MYLHTDVFVRVFFSTASLRPEAPEGKGRAHHVLHCIRSTKPGLRKDRHCHDNRPAHLTRPDFSHSPDNRGAGRRPGLPGALSLNGREESPLRARQLWVTGRRVGGPQFSVVPKPPPARARSPTQKERAQGNGHHSGLAGLTEFPLGLPCTWDNGVSSERGLIYIALPHSEGLFQHQGQRD